MESVDSHSEQFVLVTTVHRSGDLRDAAHKFCITCAHVETRMHGMLLHSVMSIPLTMPIELATLGTLT
jgi:hypothetical protein